MFWDGRVAYFHRQQNSNSHQSIKIFCHNERTLRRVKSFHQNFCPWQTYSNSDTLASLQYWCPDKMQFVWYELSSDNVGSLCFVGLFHWTPGPKWSLEHAGSVHFSSHRCPEGCPAKLRIASLKVAPHFCQVRFIYSPTKDIHFCHVQILT
jgi:hypothetical protein